jgi:hypothetical protein
MFLGDGKIIAKSGYSIDAIDKTTSASLVLMAGLFFHALSPVILTIPDTYNRGKVNLKFKEGLVQKSIEGKRVKKNGMAVVSFLMPAMDYVKIEIEN